MYFVVYVQLVPDLSNVVSIPTKNQQTMLQTRTLIIVILGKDGTQCHVFSPLHFASDTLFFFNQLHFLFVRRLRQAYAHLRGRANFGENRRKNGKTVPTNVPETAVHYGVKKQCFVAFPSQSRAVVGDIRKNGQNFSDLNFHKI